MFTPSYVKHSKLLLRHAQKYLRYKKDVLSEANRAEVAAGVARLETALRQKKEDEIKASAEALDAKLHKLTPVTWESHWRENVEVFLVAIVVAIGIRSYFLQPFKIPTGSMQPTLNGIIGHPMTEAPPNLLQRAVEFVVLGRNYIDVVSQEDDRVMQVLPQKYAFFFTFSRVLCQRQTLLVYAAPDTLRLDFGLAPGKIFRKGDVMARGAVDTGDQVFVDKFTYNFVKPHRGDVFVFRTDDIRGIDPRVSGYMFSHSPSQDEQGAPFYIKRLVALPGDSIRVEPPKIYIDGTPPTAFGIERVMSAVPPYRGYGAAPNPVDDVPWHGGVLRVDVSVPFHVPKDGYFAMGDNSYNSLDSRYWGPVPQENLVGRGLLVYWPFTHHWGLIR